MDFANIKRPLGRDIADLVSLKELKDKNTERSVLVGKVINKKLSRRMISSLRFPEQVLPMCVRGGNDQPTVTGILAPC